ncbi:MAG: Clp protease ClpP [Oscillospiraceae bacterium]|nr:Clp protease ClpP [Oscillospiraceae bacterium]
MKRYYSLEKVNQTATLNIYGDITSWPWFEGDTSAVNLSKQLEEMGDVNEIDVYINSYGGEVSEGLAIYNALRRHKAKVKTVCDGFACSIASVIFMAGDERVMNEASLLMIHKTWTRAEGNADELRKQADDLDIISQASVEAYKSHSTLTEKQIKKLMDNETWILPEKALEYGFATSIEKTENTALAQNSFKFLFQILKAHQEKADEEEEEPENDPENEEQDEESSPPDDDTGDGTDGEEDSDTSDEDEAAEKEKETAQKWSGFFNTLIQKI